MQKDNLSSNYYKTNDAEEDLNFFFNISVISLKKIIFFLFFFPNVFFPPHYLLAEMQGREIQNYVRSETTFEARKRKAYKNAFPH